MSLVFDQIKEVEGGTNFRFQVIVADDFSDPRTSRRLSELCDKYAFTYLRQESNLGVVGNVNTAWQRSSGSYFILLNSDAIIGPGALISILSIFNSDSSVGLVTIPTFEDFRIQLTHSITWRQLNTYLSESRDGKLHYVDACTAVSYAIGIRRDSLKSSWLMDPIYGRGYGEDSDLHYQVVSHGWRSVFTLDTAASHEGGATFGNDEGVSETRKMGREVFFERWGVRYYAEIANHSRALRRAIKMRVSGLHEHREESLSETTWIISPGLSNKIGGLRVAEQYAVQQSLGSANIRFVSTHDNNVSNVGDLILTTPSAIARKSVKPGDNLVLFGIGGIRWVKSLPFPMKSFELIYAAQGPDDLIWPEGFSDYRFLASEVKKYLVNSPAMSKIVFDLVGDFESVTLVPDLSYAFYSGHSTNQVREIDVLMIIREEWGKNPNYHTSLANYLSLYCSVTVVTDANSPSFAKEVRVLPSLGNSEILKLMKNSKILVDGSLFEGFGMVPREAAYSGAHVFITGNAGGTDELLNFESHFSKVPALWDVHGAAKQIEKKLSSLHYCLGCDFCESF
jgi:GT2 family glycosyltransferase